MEHYHPHTPTLNFPAGYDINALLLDLQSRDGAVRKQARETLGRLGNRIVPALVQLLSQHSDQIRWEACKTLERVCAPDAGIALAEALLDESMDVRWVAAEALIALDDCAIEPLLLVLQHHFDSAMLRDAAHHVLYQLRQKFIFDREIEMVFESLDSTLPTFRVGINAMFALNYVKKQKQFFIRKKERH